MYDGSDIDTAEMNEWLDDTIATMLNGQRPGNVLEIGSGTGMIPSTWATACRATWG
ncbi:hypothetical protein P3342_007410 [Pyrenophora teres f. teres]|nr:hypothetical protein P3342_007410 [Pyrenophora teres f. teres]